MRLSARSIAPLLFLSGFCALIYQVAWTREFRLIFGATTAASAAVVAIFIGGLGAGGLLLGPRADRDSRPLLLYARLECAVALTAAISPFLLMLARAVYVTMGGTLTLGLTLGTAVRLVLSALVLAAPTLLMGGTLPAAARAIARDEDTGRRDVALLYGVNTLGAVAGAFAGTFFMLEVFGTRQTLWLSCLVNLLVAFLAFSISKRSSQPETAEAPSPQPAAAAAPARLVLVSAAVVGFVFFLMELVWYRMLGPILGGTVFTFGLILAVALLGIGLGGAAYALLRENRSPSLNGFAATCLFEAAAIAVPFAVGDRIAVGAAVLRPLGAIWSFGGFALGWTLVTCAVVLPAALVAGYQFPLLVGLLGRGREEVGRQVGLTYAWNTAGAIVGSLAGGFGLLPMFSAPGVWRAAVVLLILLGLAASLAEYRSTRRPQPVVGRAALAGLTALLLLARGPTAVWRHSQIGAGRNAPPTASANAYEDWLRSARGAVVWEADGVESSVALVTTDSGYAFMLNGKNDGTTRADAATMVMSGLLGPLLHPEARTALVIGLGTGGTAGWLAAVPGIERVDVVELERLILDVARDCTPANRGVLDNPAVSITIGDAREALLVSKRRYDIIFSEPSNPYRAGVASLFTREYYEAVHERIAPGGLFLQWVQAYEVDAATLATVYATLRGAFPHVETWQVGSNDLVLVASREERAYDVARLRERLAQQPIRAGMRAVWGVRDLEGFLAFFVAQDGLARDLTRRGEINTDDRNVVEFGFARTLGRRSLLAVAQLRQAAAARGEDRPGVVGDVDWRRVAAARMAFYPRAEMAPRLWERLGPELRVVGSFHERSLANDSRGAVAAWQALGREPWTDTEEKLLAQALAELGDERALALAETRRTDWPLEAEAIVAILRYRQGRLDDATEALERALHGLRTDAWQDLALLRRAVVLAGAIASTDPGRALRMHALLRHRFSLALFEDQRLVALAQALERLAPGSECLEVMAALEPNVPWLGDWLALRRECYRRAGSPLAGRAAADFEAFQLGEPVRFDAGLAPASAQSGVEKKPE